MMQRESGMSAGEERLETPSWLVPVLDRFERVGYFEDHEIAGHISEAITKAESATEVEKNAANAERWAFQFLPQDSGEPSCWKTHFGPSMEMADARLPDISWINPAVIAYWTERMAQAKHPLLRARYADLVWDLSKAACNLKPPIEAARTAVDGYAACAGLADSDSAIAVSDKLQRALKIALSVGDKPRADKIRDALFDLFSRVDETWGWLTLFDIVEEHNKIEFSSTQIDSMIAGLESYVTTIAAKSDGGEPGPVFSVAGRLINHYQRLGRKADAERVVLASGQAVERRSASANHTVAHFWLDQVFRFYRVNGLDSEAERVQIFARQRGEKAEGEMKSIAVEVEIPADEFEKFLNGITEGGLDQALTNIAVYFVPDPHELRATSEKLRKQSPLASMIPVAKVSEGQVVGNIGAGDSDPEGALLHDISKAIDYAMPFLEKAFDRARARYSATPEQVVELLFESPAFTVRFQGIIKLGVEAYFAGDHPKAIHLLVPQIENALRFLLTLLGRPANKARRGDPASMTEKTLTDILEHEPVIKWMLGEPAHAYLLSFLADPRGRNLRNRMSHGLMAAEEFNRGISDRVLHILLMLGTIRRKGAAEARPDEPEGEAIFPD
jgi:hypothetical protein